MKKIVYSFFALSLLVTTSCKKEFFDINDSPNSPTESSITPNLLLPRALSVTASRTGTSFDYAAFWMGYWSRSGSYGQSIEIESYNITTGFQTGQWTGWYDILNDINLMEKKAKGTSPFYEAAAKTLKANGFMYLVDQYNNVPYTKAFDIQNNILPGYDKGEDIYADLFVQLEAAAKLFANASTDPAIATSDVMFHGDTNKWRKFVNTLRLKLLIHESQVVSVAARTAVIAQITADGSGYLGAGETAAVNPGYAVNDGQQNPFYNTYKITALGILDSYNRANNYILNTYKANNDPRYTRVFSAAAIPLSTADTYRGTNFGETVANNDPFKANNQSDVAGPGLAVSPTQSQPVITSVESLFLQAEAMQRGWIPGVALTTYQAAITESFRYLGAPATDAATYLARPNVAITFGGDPIKQIAYQKYLSLIGLDNFEAYVDYRRLGVPTDLPLSLSTSRNGFNVPLRLLYPQSEYNNNSANVTGQGTINAQTSTIFWDR
jgi:hypothetical protein